MLLDLNRFRRPHERLARAVQPGELAPEEEAYRIVAPVDLVLDVYRNSAAFRLTGRLRTVLELACSRCLEPFPLVVDASFDQRYRPASELSTEPEAEIGDDDIETGYYRDDRIDLGDLLREQFYLALPMKPLCDPGCRGLCPQCGTNLNSGRCGCEPAWSDPRLAPLRRLASPHHS